MARKVRHSHDLKGLLKSRQNRGTAEYLEELHYSKKIFFQEQTGAASSCFESSVLYEGM